MREGVLAVLDALRTGIGAEAIGLFDDDRADSRAGGAEAPRAHTPPNFWDAFGDLPCANLDWRSFYLKLKADQRVELSCACGAGHRLHGFLMHGRWVLLLVAPAALTASAPAVVASALKALADKLPPARPPQDEIYQSDDDAFGDSGPRPASAGAPLWWVRKARQ